MFSGLRSKATAIVKSLDPVEHIKFLSKQVTDDSSILNQNLRDVIKYLGDGPHHDRADQALGSMIAAHASRQLSTIWTVLLQMLREAVDNTRAQLSILKHFSHIANRIAIPQRSNAFRVFAKEIMTVCGSQDVVGDRQFPVACNTILVALGVHADVDLARALMEKLLSGLFSWTRTDSKRAACSICSTLIFSTTGCESFSTTITNLQSSGRSLQGTSLMVDSCLPLLLEQAVRLSPGENPTNYASVREVSRWVVSNLINQLAEGSMEAMVLPVLASCYSRLHAFGVHHSTSHLKKGGAEPSSFSLPQPSSSGYDSDSDHPLGTLLPIIMRRDSEIRDRAIAILSSRDTIKKILWCPVISLLQHTGLSQSASPAFEKEMALLLDLAECPDSMARCEALVAIACTMETSEREESLFSAALVDQLMAKAVEAHRRYSSERCSLTVKGTLRLISSCFQQVRSDKMTREVLHCVLRSHMDMSNNLNAMGTLQLEVLSLVEHTVEHLTGEALAYLLMCLQKGDVKVREKAVRVLIRLCEESVIDGLQLLEPTLRGVDFIEGAVIVGGGGGMGSSSHSASTAQKSKNAQFLSVSPVLQKARNYHTVIAHLYHMLVSLSCDTQKAESALVQIIADGLRRVVEAASESLTPIFRNQAYCSNAEDTYESGAPLEHQVLATLNALFNCVYGATPFPIDTVCIILESLCTCVLALGERGTQFDVHLHKRLFSFVWNVLVHCCSHIDAVTFPKLSQDASLYTGVIPPHPIMSALVAAAGTTAMSSSEYSESSSFFSLIRQCSRLLEALMRWGHRSTLFVAHMRAQYHHFLAIMDVMVAVQPVEALRSTRRLLLTILTQHGTGAGEMVLPPAATLELCERAVASAIPVLNRSLSFDLMAVGEEVFGFLEVLAEMDTTAGWTVCYGTIDRSFQLFVRMVEISTDGSYYNAVSGPHVIPPIIRALYKILHSPHRLRAFRAFSPDLDAAPMEPVGEVWPSQRSLKIDNAGGARDDTDEEDLLCRPIGTSPLRFHAFDKISALIRNAHDRLQSRVFAGVEAIVEDRAPRVSSAVAGQNPNKKKERSVTVACTASPARHNEIMRWLETTTNADLLVRFLKSMGQDLSALCAVRNGCGSPDENHCTDAATPTTTTAVVRDFLFQQAFYIGHASASSGKVREACDRLADGLMAYYEELLLVSSTTSAPPNGGPCPMLTLAVCAGALKRSLLRKAIQHTVNYCLAHCSSVVGSSADQNEGTSSLALSSVARSVDVAPVDIENLFRLIEDPNSCTALDGLEIDLTSVGQVVESLGAASLSFPDAMGMSSHNSPMALHTLKALLSVLPPAVYWRGVSELLLRVAATTSEVSDDSVITNDVLLLPLVVVAVRQSDTIPAFPTLLYNEDVWSLLVGLFPAYSAAVIRDDMLQPTVATPAENDEANAGYASHLIKTVDWARIGQIVQSLVRHSSTLLSDIRTIGLCVAETLSPNTLMHIEAIVPLSLCSPPSPSSLHDPEGEGLLLAFRFEYLRHYLASLVVVDIDTEAELMPMPTGGDDDADVRTTDDQLPAVMDLIRSLPFCGRNLFAFPLARITAGDLLEMTLVCSSKADGVTLMRALLSVCRQAPESVSHQCIVAVVCALVRCELTTEDFRCDLEFAMPLLRVIASFTQLTSDYSSATLSPDDRLALRYSAMCLLVLVSPEGDGLWECLLIDEMKAAKEKQAETESGITQDEITEAKCLVISTLTAVLELPPARHTGYCAGMTNTNANTEHDKKETSTISASLKAVAQATLSIFVRSSLLLGGINESILWLVVKCCPSSIWQCILSCELFSDTELGVLQFVLKMNQTVGVGPDLVMELHARYTPLLLSYGTTRELDGDEQHVAFWLMTSILLHIVGSEERHTKPKPHMSLSDSLALYNNDFPLTHMASPVVGLIRSTVDELLFPINARLSIPNGERHWNIHARGHLLPVLGRRILAKEDAGKIYSSILHMYLHVVNCVFGGLDTFSPSTVSDTFGTLSVLASGNASLLKHSPAADGTIASSILQRLFGWYNKHAADAVSSVDKSHSAVYFGNSLFPEPTSSLEFCDNFNILTCATVISSLFMRGNELLPGAVDVGFILDKMLSMDLMSNQSALTAIVVMSGSSTRREMSYVAPLLTQRLLKELDRCVRGSLSFSFGILQMLRTAFSILSAFPDDAVTMKVCEAVWNVVVNEGSGGRRIQHYAHYMLQSIVNLHTVSETQWSILRAIVSLPNDGCDGGGNNQQSGEKGGGLTNNSLLFGSNNDLGSGSFAFASGLFAHDSNAGKVVESGRQFFSELFQSGGGGGAGGSNDGGTAASCSTTSQPTSVTAPPGTGAVTPTTEKHPDTAQQQEQTQQQKTSIFPFSRNSAAAGNGSATINSVNVSITLTKSGPNLTNSSTTAANPQGRSEGSPSNVGGIPDWGYHPIRNTIVSAGMRRKAQLSVAELEENAASTVASTVYGTTPNLLQLTTIASFVLRSHEGGEGGLEEADRNRVTILDMLRQVDEKPSAVGDTFLIIVYALLETVLDPQDAMFVLLNRFNFSASSLFLFNQSLRRAARVAGVQHAPFPVEDLALYFDAAGRRYMHADNAWWVFANALSAVILWSNSSGMLGDKGPANSDTTLSTSLTSADVPLGALVGNGSLRLLCSTYVHILNSSSKHLSSPALAIPHTNEVISNGNTTAVASAGAVAAADTAIEMNGTAAERSDEEGGTQGKNNLRTVLEEVLNLASRTADQQEGQQEGSGAALKSVVGELRGLSTR